MIRRIVFCLCLLGALALGAVPSRPSAITWFNYGIEGGRAAVFKIFRDSAGRTWLGTNSGLYVFTGYDAYPCTFADGNPLRAQVYGLVECDGRLYAGTNDGLFVVDLATLEASRPCEDSPREIRSMICRDGMIWLGALSGLYFYDIDGRTVGAPVAGLPHQAVYSLLEVPGGDVYVGTYNGLSRYSATERVFADVALPGVSAAPNVFVNALCYSGQRLFIGTEGALLSYSMVRGTAERLPAFDGYSVKALCEGQGGSLIAGTDDGLMMLAPDGSVAICRHDSRMAASIMSNVVWSLYADTAGGDVWAGTEVGVAIASTDPDVRVFAISDLTGMGEGMQAARILRDSRGRLWVGGSNGIIRFGDSTAWFLPGKGERNLSHGRVRDVFEDSSGRIWLATDGGIHLYDEAGGYFVNHRMTDSGRHAMANWVYGILEEPSDSTLWAAGYLGGVFVEKLVNFSAEGTSHVADTVFTSAQGLPNEYIGQMVRDSQGNKWILHFRDTALTRIDGATGEVSRVSLADIGAGEPSVLCPGPDGLLWCGCYGGVVAIRPDGQPVGKVLRFPVGAGDDVVTAMAAVGADLWIATADAVWALDPRDGSINMVPVPEKDYTAIYYDSKHHCVVLGASDEIVFAEPGRIMSRVRGERIDLLRLTEGGERASARFLSDRTEWEVKLPYSNRDISLAVGTASFSPCDYLRFCWRLGDKDVWHLMDEGDNKVALTGLAPGRHVLEVADAADMANAVKVRFEVAYPWYATKWAIAFYILAAAALVAGAVFAARRRHRRRIEDIKRRNVLSAVENRLFFLSNISHELKTPLSMIIAPLSRLRASGLGEPAEKDIDTAYHSAIKLNSLIHQTVEIDRLEASGEDMLIFSLLDVAEFCGRVFEGYRQTCQDRNFVFSAPETHIYARTDAVKLESLLNNLLSNAVKYSSPGGTVALSVGLSPTEPDFFEIGISDDGIGIPPEEQSLVFQRLYRSPRSAATREGTGIGLYLVKEYAGLLGGNVVLESTPGEGSLFRLRLPVGDVGDMCGLSGETDGTAGSGAPAGDKRKRVLIVDDNDVIARFVSSLFDGEYNCATASDGMAGLALASTFRPDIIIADEMMPRMTGLEMSRRLRANPATATVPIILLTAKDSAVIQGESIASGIDAFMPKPFEAPVLGAKVRQLLESAERMRRSVLLEHSTDASGDTVVESAAEKQFAAVTELIERQLSNPDLNVDYVSRELSIPPKTLYRLIKKLVGVSPVDYIRQTRLRKAAMLLEQRKFSVSEVMYMVGFSSSSYFSKCFVALFGCTPGQYAARFTADDR